MGDGEYISNDCCSPSVTTAPCHAHSRIIQVHTYHPHSASQQPDSRSLPFKSSKCGWLVWAGDVIATTSPSGDYPIPQQQPPPVRNTTHKAIALIIVLSLARAAIFFVIVLLPSSVLHLAWLARFADVSS